MIQFDHVSARYGNHLVLNDITLEISGGELVSLVGPSGAGKTSLLNTLIGEFSIEQGSITVDGYEINEFDMVTLQEYRQKIGMVFQDYKLLPQKTVYENVAFALEVCEWNDEDVRERVIAVLDRVGLLDHEGKFPHQLAGGEMQRAAIARALVHRPRLLIADEPTGNLDYWHALSILDLLMSINAEGVTIVMATHNRELVDRLGRRVIALRDGQIVSDKSNGGYEVDLLISGGDGAVNDLVGEVEILTIDL